MPELPEIMNLALQMEHELKNKHLIDVEILQDKCLNISADEFKTNILNKKILAVQPNGKWIFTLLDDDYHMLINLGMGGDIRYLPSDENLPDKYKFKFIFNDNTVLTIGFWWFGYIHLLKKTELKSHKMTASLGVSPLDGEQFTLDNFLDLLGKKRGNIKNFLTNQNLIAGIGNVYVQDILFKAKLHPQKKINEISAEQKKTLYNVILENLKEAVAQRGIAYERDLYGKPGKIRSCLVGYRDGKPCPVCNTIIEKIKTGSTHSYVCPQCQSEQ